MSKNRIADQVADLLEQRLASGYWPIGSRLTAERQLAEELQVSRSSLREALQQLISKGLLASRVGGGTYVVSTKPIGFVDPMLSLFKENPEYRFDVLEIRHALEGNAAWYAALRATEEDKAHIQTCFERMIQLHGKGNPLEEAQADAAFHLAIAEASHNLVLLHVMRSLFDLLQNSISHSLDKLYTLPVMI
ncbi:FCD domain-containing protein [Thiofilum flexile]|uniref:FCD domain-containing protein n=1 Tax=Thiofilum flexile TaxID=125627 RepID=UPI000382841E|nr:FCD domain-containing protein [Thiofilum flexile]